MSTTTSKGSWRGSGKPATRGSSGKPTTRGRGSSDRGRGGKTVELADNQEIVTKEQMAAATRDYDGMSELIAHLFITLGYTNVVLEQKSTSNDQEQARRIYERLSRQVKIRVCNEFLEHLTRLNKELELCECGNLSKLFQSGTFIPMVYAGHFDEGTIKTFPVFSAIVYKGNVDPGYNYQPTVYTP